MIFNKLRAGLALALPIALLTWGSALVAAPESQYLDRIVAVVEKDIIMDSELRLQVQRTVEELKAKGVTSVPNKQVVIEKALSDLVDTKLLLAEAERQGLDADEETMRNAIASVARDNGLSVEDLQRALAQEGITVEQFREEIRTRLLKERLITREVTNRIQISKAEVDHFIATSGGALSSRESVRLQHILVATPEAATSDELDAARLRADSVLQRLNAGEEFTTVAQEISDGRQALQGGDLGWLEMRQIPELFVVPANRMARGAVEGPLQNSGGFHIIKLLDYRGGDRNIVRQSKTRHILMQSSENLSDGEVQQRLIKLYDRIDQGADFAELARASSMDQVSAIRGGDIGWVSPGEMVPEFENEMNKLKAGEVSQPFKSRYGWHIVQVTEHRDHDATQEAILAKARLAVRNRKLEEALKLYLQRLRDEAYIEVRREDLSSF